MNQFKAQLVQNGPNGQKLTEIDHSRPKWTKLEQMV